MRFWYTFNTEKSNEINVGMNEGQEIKRRVTKNGLGFDLNSAGMIIIPIARMNSN